MKLLTLSLLLLALTKNANAHSSRCAEDEFYQLKETGEWESFIQNRSYLEVIGKRFIGLEKASDDKRTCLFGFNQPAYQRPWVAETRTGFVCFDTGRYDLRELKEHCISGENNCEINLAAISIGIGNIKIFEPTMEALPEVDWTQSQAMDYFSRYPRTVTVKFFPQPRTSVRGDTNSGGLSTFE